MNVVEGTLITESLRTGTILKGFPLTVMGIRKVEANLSPEQVTAGLSRIWTIIDFEVPLECAGSLADALSQAVEPIGWYVNLQSEPESFVVFSDWVFRYLRGDPHGRAQAQAHGRALGIPGPQLDWTV